MAANRSSNLCLALALAWCCLALTGCARGRLIKATAVPPEYLVGHIDNAQTLDLSKLATSSASNELVDCGDLLILTIDSGYLDDRENPETTIRVGEDGNAQVPLVGPVQVAGMELTAAEQVVRSASIERGVYRNPTVTLAMKQPRVNRVTVLGAVNTPGTYELPRSTSSLLAAIVKAEGLAPEAGVEVEIRRPALRSEAVPSEPDSSVAGQGPQLAGYTQAGQGHAVLRPASTARINLISATQEAGGKREYYLDDGDVVMVEKRDPLPVHVIGLVARPGQVHLPVNQDTHLLDAIALAGGASSPYVNKILLLRRVSGSDEPLVIEVSLRDAKRTGRGNFLLGPGDVVSVEQSAPNFAMDMFKTVIPYAISPTLTATLLR